MLDPEHPDTNLIRRGATNFLAAGDAGEALTMAQVILADQTKALGPNHSWTKASARVTADALDALGGEERISADDEGTDMLFLKVQKCAEQFRFGARVYNANLLSKNAARRMQVALR
jgi:hypothetical protein